MHVNTKLSVTEDKRSQKKKSANPHWEFKIISEEFLRSR